MNRQPLQDAWRDWTGTIECTDTDRTWSADDLHEKTDQAIAVLTQQGIQPGDRVAVVLRMRLRNCAMSPFDHANANTVFTSQSRVIS